MNKNRSERRKRSDYFELICMKNNTENINNFPSNDGFTKYLNQPLGKDTALVKLRQIPVAAEVIQEKGTDWWETYVFNEVDGCSLGLFVAAAKKSGVEIPQNIINAINNADGVYSRPKIKITNDRSKMIKVVLDSVYQFNERELTVFQRGGHLCRVRDTDENSAIIEDLNDSSMLNLMGECSTFSKFNGKEDVSAKPPLDIARGILNLPQWDVPRIRGITAIPVIRPDGTILDVPGFDEVTGLYYKPEKKLTVPEIPEEPTKEEAIAAAKFIIDELLCDFPFDGKKGEHGSSRANAIAAFLTPVVRSVIDGCVPIYLISKPAPGTGATRLAELISIVALGKPMEALSAPDNEEEWRKQITSWMREGKPIISLDNIESDLKSSGLSRALTSRIWTDRTLGKSESMGYPQLACWIATGNNLRLGGDLPRRSYVSYMDAKMPRPWERNPKLFRHLNILAWAKENRGLLLSKLLIMARAWFVAGATRWDGKQLGGFEDFVGIVGGILEYAGVTDFLANLDTMYTESDAGGSDWGIFLTVWFDNYRDEKKNTTKPLTSSQLLELIMDGDYSPLSPVVPEDISTALRYNTPGNAIKLGRILGKKKDVIHAVGDKVNKMNLCLTKGKDEKGREQVWIVENRRDEHIG